MSISKHYQGEGGQAYTQHRQDDPFNYGYEVDFEYFRPYLKGNNAVLDFGCGNGGILRLAAREVTVADGLEVNDAAGEIARRQGLNVFSSLSKLPAGRLYDAVFSNHVLEHVRDVCDALENLRAFLKPGGLLLLKLPIDDPSSRYQRNWSTNDPDHHLQTWTPRLLVNTLFEAGYEVSECRVITSAWHPKLFRFKALGLTPFLFWLLAVVRRRRQLFAVAKRPQQ